MYTQPIQSQTMASRSKVTQLNDCHVVIDGKNSGLLSRDTPFINKNVSIMGDESKCQKKKKGLSELKSLYPKKQ